MRVLILALALQGCTFYGDLLHEASRQDVDPMYRRFEKDRRADQKDEDRRDARKALKEKGR